MTPAADGHRDYSGTPLATKLGIREGARVRVLGGPEGLLDRLEPLPDGVAFVQRGNDLDVVLAFTTSAAELRRRMPALVRSIGSAGRLWIAWPKKASKVPTDVSFEVVQGLGLEAGLVDNKTAAIDEVFQGLQFVYRRADRPGAR
jgi:hypothetical protein